MKLGKRRVKRSSVVTYRTRIQVSPDRAVDNFGEVTERKRKAAAQARALGHDLDVWHQRPNDPSGRWNAFCLTCNRPVVVCTEIPEGFPEIYGPAVKVDCAGEGVDKSPVA